LASQQSALFDILRLAIFNEFKNSASLPGVANSKHRKREREREKKSGCATCQLLTVLFEIQKEFMMFFGISKKTHYINVSPKLFLRFQAAMKLALNCRCPIFETSSPKKTTGCHQVASEMSVINLCVFLALNAFQNIGQKHSKYTYFS